MMIPTELLPILNQEISRRQLPADFISTIERIYLPLSQHLAQRKPQDTKPLLVSFNGAQGSGKSTITAFLALILTHYFKLDTVDISIDDFYLTHADRQELAKQIHPLLATRGVPGTHDIKLAEQTLSCLMEPQNYPCSIPRFDKSMDDRMPLTAWSEVENPVDVILFEGWCNHAPIETDETLMKPVNGLEAEEDGDGIWRRYVNRQLSLYHERIFNQADCLIFLQVPSFEKVYEWRGLQEKKLMKTSAQDGHAVMDEQQLKRFIQHYERITRNCLRELPEQADYLLLLNELHGIDDLKIASERKNV